MFQTPMCGIIGYSPIFPTDETVDAFRRLFDESRARGTHAYGLAFPTLEGICVTKSFDWTVIPASFQPDVPSIAHCRYSQSGDWQNMVNNQPLVVGNMAVAHNGVIHMGTKEEFEREFHVTCMADNDSEIFLQRLKQQSATDFIKSITGSFAAVWLEGQNLFAARNSRRPLWRCEDFGAIWYVSTADIFKRAGFRQPTELPINIAFGIV